MKRLLASFAACAVLLTAWSVASAQPAGDKQKALELYEKGNTQYNLGRWAQAVEYFTQAYEAYNAPEFLFNIAQSHRQAGDCPSALFFYRRYLANKPDAPNKSEVDGFIADLTKQCESGSSGGTSGGGSTSGGTSGGRTGGTTGGSTTGGTTGGTTTGGTIGGTTTGGTGGTTTGGTTTGGTTTGGTTTTGTSPSGSGTQVATRPAGEVEEEYDDEDTDPYYEEWDERPRLIATHAAFGPSFLSAGDLETPVLFNFTIGAGYPLYFGDIGVEAGGLITYNPVPWQGDMPGVTGTAVMTGILLNGGATYPILPKLQARGDLGMGLLVVSGLDSGNPFLEANQFADGPVTMFHLRMALGAEYQLTRNVAVNAQPIVLSVSPAGQMRDDISALTRFEMLVGASYRM